MKLTQRQKYALMEVVTYEMKEMLEYVVDAEENGHYGILEELCGSESKNEQIVARSLRAMYTIDDAFGVTPEYIDNEIIMKSYHLRGQ